MTGSSLEVPLTLWMAYWDCLTGNGYIEPVYGEDMTGTVQSIYTSENLYRFPGGNIFFAGNVYYSLILLSQPSLWRLGRETRCTSGGITAKGLSGTCRRREA